MSSALVACLRALHWGQGRLMLSSLKITGCILTPPAITPWKVLQGTEWLLQNFLWLLHSLQRYVYPTVWEVYWSEPCISLTNAGYRFSRVDQHCKQQQMLEVSPCFLKLVLIMPLVSSLDWLNQMPPGLVDSYLCKDHYLGMQTIVHQLDEPWGIACPGLMLGLVMVVRSSFMN